MPTILAIVFICYMFMRHNSGMWNYLAIVCYLTASVHGEIISYKGTSYGPGHYIKNNIIPVNMAVRGTHRRMVEDYDHCKNNGSLNIASAYMDMRLFFNLNCDTQFIQEGTVVQYYTFQTFNGDTLSAMITAVYAPQVTPARIIVTMDGEVAEGDLAGGMFSKLQTFDTKQVFQECNKEPGMQKIDIIHEEITITTPNGKVTCTSAHGQAFYSYKPGLLFANALNRQTYRHKRSNFQ